MWEVRRGEAHYSGHHIRASDDMERDDYPAMAETFEELVGRHLDGLYSAALCFTRDEHRAEVLLQEAAIRGFHEFAGGEDEARFRQWMLGLVVQAYLRRERRRGQDPLAGRGVTVGEDLETGSSGPGLPERGSKRYRAFGDWLDRVLGDLDPGDRMILWLSDVERLRSRDVSEMIGVTETEVRGRHYRARRTLSAWARAELARWAASGSRS